MRRTGTFHKRLAAKGGVSAGELISGGTGVVLGSTPVLCVIIYDARWREDQSVAPEHVDVLIVGAGISGLDAAVHLQKLRPGTDYAIVEGRGKPGGTWDLFRYPGIRSDSDMFTLGFSFKPWTEAKVIADAPAIKRYLDETITEYGIGDRIRYHHKVISAAWSSALGRWTVELLAEGQPKQMSCRFLFMAAGYYKYAHGYAPQFPGQETFHGQIIHPQLWPEGLDYTNKRVVIIGSGATAVTLLPAMADKAQHITMLQRSPSYLFSRPAHDPIFNFFRRVLPAGPAYALGRWKNTTMQVINFWLARTFPKAIGSKLIDEARKRLPPGYDMKKHFSPSYGPWVQRVCLVPDDDFFKAICSRKADVETDDISRFTPTGIALKSGKELPADIIISATGLELEIAGGIHISVDGAPVNYGETLTYKGVMASGVPNMASVFGYLAASWTLRADLVATYVCRLLNAMDAKGYSVVLPPKRAPGTPAYPLFDFTSGYLQRGASILPKQGAAPPWRQSQHYWVDIWRLKWAPVEDGILQFSAAPSAAAANPPQALAQAAE
jgi:monooxygenase